MRIAFYQRCVFNRPTSGPTGTQRVDAIATACIQASISAFALVWIDKKSKVSTSTDAVVHPEISNIVPIEPRDTPRVEHSHDALSLPVAEQAKCATSDEINARTVSTLPIRRSYPAMRCEIRKKRGSRKKSW